MRMALLMLMPAAALAIYDMKWLDASRWRCPSCNDGRWGIDYSVQPSGAGGSWPYPWLNKYVFGAGPWVGCVVGSDTLVSQGYNTNSGGTELTPTDVAHLEEGSGSPDDRIYLFPGDWPPLGDRFPYAPQEPLSDQDLWYVCCDMASENHVAPGKPIGFDLTLTGYTFTDSSCGDMLFLRYGLTNRSSGPMRSVLFGLVIDGDVGDEQDDLAGLILDREFGVGPDTIAVTNTGFIYDYDNVEMQNGDGQWESGTPGAVAVRLLSAPGEMGLSSFRVLRRGDDPLTDVDQYLTLAGYDFSTREYSPYDSMDVVPADKRFVMSCGPFDLDSDSTAVFYYALIGSPHGDWVEIGPKHDTLELAVRCSLAYRIFRDRLARVGSHTSGRRVEVSIAPNPFSRAMPLGLTSKGDAPISATVFDVNGRQVKHLPRGSHLSWDGQDCAGHVVPAGIYFVHVRQGKLIQVHKVLFSGE